MNSRENSMGGRNPTALASGASLPPQIENLDLNCHIVQRTYGRALSRRLSNYVTPCSRGAHRPLRLSRLPRPDRKSSWHVPSAKNPESGRNDGRAVLLGRGSVSGPPMALHEVPTLESKPRCTTPMPTTPRCQNYLSIHKEVTLSKLCCFQYTRRE